MEENQNQTPPQQNSVRYTDTTGNSAQIEQGSVSDLLDGAVQQADYGPARVEPVKKPTKMIASIVGAIVAVFGIGMLLILSGDQPEDPASRNATARFDEVTLSEDQFDQIEDVSISISPTEQLQVNGQLVANNSLVLAPTTRPTAPLQGQVYFDEDSSNLLLYSGEDFISLVGTPTVDALTERVTAVEALAGQSGGDILQGGNFFGTTFRIGSRDAQDVAIVTGDVERLTVDTTGAVQLSSGVLRLSSSTGFRATIDTAALQADRTITLPDLSGEVCLTSGNCVGIGNVLTAGGNAFGGDVQIGTTDDYAFGIITDGEERISVTNDGQIGFGGPPTDPNSNVQIGGPITDASGGSLLLVEGESTSQTNSLRAAEIRLTSSVIGPPAGIFPRALQVESIFTGGNVGGAVISAAGFETTYNGGAQAAEVVGVFSRARANAGGGVTDLRVNVTAINNDFLAVITNAYGYYATASINRNAGGSIQNVYGLYVEEETDSVNSYGVVVEGATTAALWLGSGGDYTGADDGIQFGSARDTNLYRGGTGLLQSDGALTLAGNLTIDAGGGASALVVDAANSRAAIGGATLGAKLAVYDATATSDVNLLTLASDVGGSENIVFRIDSDGDIFTDGATTIGGPADVAERYENYDGAVPGDVVSFSTARAVRKSNSGYEQALAGVVSTEPGLILSGNTAGVDVALVGRVPVKISLENGPIARGDYLTSSATLPGYAMKATQTGPVLGIAMEDLADGTGSGAGSATSDPNLGVIDIFVSLGQYNPLSGQQLAADAAVFSNLLAAGGEIDVLSTQQLEAQTARITSELRVAQIVSERPLSFAGARPTVNVTAAGATDSVATIRGVDATGEFTLVPSQTIAPGEVVEVQFSSAVAVDPIVVLSAVGESGGVRYAVADTSTSGFTVRVFDELQAGVQYSFSYFVSTAVSGP